MIEKKSGIFTTLSQAIQSLNKSLGGVVKEYEKMQLETRREALLESLRSLHSAMIDFTKRYPEVRTKVEEKFIYDLEKSFFEEGGKLSGLFFDTLSDGLLSVFNSCNVVSVKDEDSIAREFLGFHALKFYLNLKSKSGEFFSGGIYAEKSIFGDLEDKEKDKYFWAITKFFEVIVSGELAYRKNCISSIVNLLGGDFSNIEGIIRDLNSSIVSKNTYLAFVKSLKKLSYGYSSHTDPAFILIDIIIGNKTTKEEIEDKVVSRTIARILEDLTGEVENFKSRIISVFEMLIKDIKSDEYLKSKWEEKEPQLITKGKETLSALFNTTPGEKSLSEICADIISAYTIKWVADAIGFKFGEKKINPFKTLISEIALSNIKGIKEVKEIKRTLDEIKVTLGMVESIIPIVKTESEDAQNYAMEAFLVHVINQLNTIYNFIRSEKFIKMNEEFVENNMPKVSKDLTKLKELLERLATSGAEKYTEKINESLKLIDNIQQELSQKASSYSKIIKKFKQVDEFFKSRGILEKLKKSKELLSELFVTLENIQASIRENKGDIFSLKEIKKTEAVVDEMYLNVIKETYELLKELSEEIGRFLKRFNIYADFLMKELSLERKFTKGELNNVLKINAKIFSTFSELYGNLNEAYTSLFDYFLHEHSKEELEELFKDFPEIKYNRFVEKINEVKDKTERLKEQVDKVRTVITDKMERAEGEPIIPRPTDKKEAPTEPVKPTQEEKVEKSKETEKAKVLDKEKELEKVDKPKTTPKVKRKIEEPKKEEELVKETPKKPIKEEKPKEPEKEVELKEKPAEPEAKSTEIPKKEEPKEEAKIVVPLRKDYKDEEFYRDILRKFLVTLEENFDKEISIIDDLRKKSIELSDEIATGFTKLFNKSLDDSTKAKMVRFYAEDKSEFLHVIEEGVKNLLANNEEVINSVKKVITDSFDYKAEQGLKNVSYDKDSLSEILIKLLKSSIENAVDSFTKKKGIRKEHLIGILTKPEGIAVNQCVVNLSNMLEEKRMVIEALKNLPEEEKNSFIENIVKLIVNLVNKRLNISISGKEGKVRELVIRVIESKK